MNKASIIFIGSVVLLTGQAAISNEFQQWMQQQQNQFQQYKDEHDREFVAFLKHNWKQVDVLKGEVPDTAPKPVHIPVADPVHVKPEPIIIQPQVPQPLTVKPPAIPVVPAPTAKPPETSTTSKAPTPPTAKTPVNVITPPQPVVKSPVPIVPPSVTRSKTPPPAALPKSGRRLSVMFYGDEFTLYYDPRLRISMPHRLDKRAISNAWSKLSQADFEPLLQQLQSIRQQHKLNDWAFAVLVNEVSSGITAADSARVMLNWFVLIKAGFEARVAYDDISLYLLLPSQQPIYATPYFTFAGERFYAVSFDGKQHNLGKVFTYDGRYPGAEHALDMRLTSDVIDAGRDSVRKLNFTYNGKDYNVDARYNRERVDFLNTYPQLDLDLYFTATLPGDSASSLHSQLSTYIKGMPQLDAVNFLLRFVQTAWPYQTDDQQFGKENYLFPEESLYYRYTDCEDRAVLFAWLVRDLLGLEVIGLDYPGHVATAVLFTVPVKGDAVIFQGKKYIVADPTYIKAVAGMTMPDYRKVRPTVIAAN